MSVASRLISGSAASWAQIAITAISQVVLVPVYLSHWSVATYGVWLAIQALISITSTFDFGHQEFLGYEFLRIGRDDRGQLSRFLWSGVGVGLLISLAQGFLLIGISYSNLLPRVLGESEVFEPGLLHEASLVLIAQSFIWLLSTSVPGLLSRALAPFGYYPRMAWWTLFSTFVTGIAPVLAVLLGAGLLTAGLVLVAASLLVSIPVYVDSFRLLARERVPFSWPSAATAGHNFRLSLAVSGKWLLENARQQGARLVLAPLVGAAGLTAFSTMRTGANVALQGLHTVVHPLMPELMRFLHQRDQTRMESAFSTVWFVLVAALAPGVVLVQAFIEPLYLLWTRGRIPFNPALFAALSLSVLLYAVAQPAIAVVQGNNLLRAQLLLSAVAAALVVGSIYLLVPHLGVVGAGAALVAAELAATLGYRLVAQRWLRQNGLQWPRRHFLIANTSLLIAGLALGALVLLPAAKWLILLITLPLLLGNLWRYWAALPTLATQHALRLVGSLPLIRQLSFFK